MGASDGSCSNALLGNAEGWVGAGTTHLSRLELWIQGGLCEPCSSRWSGSRLLYVFHLANTLTISGTLKAQILSFLCS